MSDHVTVNRDYWNGMAADWVASGEHAWASDRVAWGNWSLPEEELRLLPDDMTGMDAIELGCGTGYVSAWMARRGARVTGIDVSAEQLATARRLQGEHGLDVTFLEGNAEATGLPDAAFDFAISEYGAAIWCDPDLWLPEAHRLLRPGGTLVFLGNHPMAIITTPLNGAPCERALHRPYRGLTGADWTGVEIDPAGIEFNRTISGWMALFDRVGFDLLRYQELFAPGDEPEDRFSVPGSWARDYPAEQVWSLRRRA
jgi:SAM-dependent methyltransferase